MTDPKEMIERLTTWLRKRAEPDSGIRYEGRYYDPDSGIRRDAYVKLHGEDADFVAANFHGRGAAELADALASLSNGDEAMIEADARLIAAAPDLLAALKCMVGHATGNMDGDMDLSDDPLTMARAALSKVQP